MLIFGRWIAMTNISGHTKIQQPGPNISAVPVLSNLCESDIVTMETNGLTNYSHIPSIFLPSLVPVGP